jgi:D-3-phosphoglycerate dehydrogenase
MPKVLFIDSTPDIDRLWKRVLRPDDIPIDVKLGGKLAEDKIAETIRGYDTIIDDATYFTAATLAACKDLRHIVFLGTGAASYIDIAAAEKLGIKVSNIKGYGDTTVAEHAMGLVFAAARHIATMHALVRAGGWRPMQGMELKGKTIGLIGVGGIGREMARLAKGIGLEVIAWNRSPVADAPARMLAIGEVLAKSDILSVHLALNDETERFLDRTKLAQTKPGVILVNTARAGVVDHAALIDLLKSGHIGHYATDVFLKEPAPADEPLLKLDNVTLTAHAGYNTPEAAMTMYRRAIDLAANG